MPPKVERYWPGKAPQYAKTSDSESDLEVARPEDDKDDPRLRRLAEARNQRSSDAPRRHIQEAEVITLPTAPVTVKDEPTGDMDEEPDAELEKRRERLRALALHRMAQQNEPEDDPFGQGSEGESEAETSEESDSMSEHEDKPVQLMKPVFVPKYGRETLLQAEREAEEEEQRALAHAAKLEERKELARIQLLEQLKLEETQNEHDVSDDDGPPDTDGIDAEEFEKWKIRELKRIKREKEEREARDKEQAETERRRNMTDAERMEEDRKLGKLDAKEKQQWNFLQRYYHRGAYYMDNEEIIKKADQVESAPTLEDRIDKEMMPKIMQRKKFGRASQVKWTHLVNEDTTTNKDNLFNAMERPAKRLAGMGAVDRPAGRKN